ncbi:MBL fold metallo-hydrolase [Pleionea sp. CnH1-48]|uniref:MBL fold metallo-hydrolase n=1 Tax=Pleionea sp. CnH1-48 TaxID=2954494 RepID=UPI0020973E94|nr:MBL fold metallo-hydrolase [Pleionea sp. CnH1-48]
MRCCSIGSGSKGNGTLIAAGDTILLVDCGFSVKETVARLAQKNLEPDDLSAILITHEHGDHARGVTAFSRKFGIPVWLTRGSRLHSSCEKLESYQWLEPGQSVSIGDIEVLPYTVPHDAREPVQFVFQSSEGKSIGLLTDTGHITPHIIEVLQSCQLLLLEFNHDLAMLQKSSYPASLKRRISGPFGHLNNDQAASLLRQPLSQLSYLVAMHLSEENNCPERVGDIIQQNLNGRDIEYFVAKQSGGFGWITLADE